MTVFVASGSSDKCYHTKRDCYHLQKASQIVNKQVEHINVFYDKCSVCEQWERRQE